MEILDLANIAGRYMELENPTAPEKIIAFGRHLRLRPGSKLIDFGCGYAEALVLWAEHFGIVGIGVDVREQACERAREKVVRRGLTERLEIVCRNGNDYPFQERHFDAATCLGASFIWGGFKQAIRAMRRAIRRGGRLGIGEEYWLRDSVPPDYARQATSVYSEYELLQIARSEGFDIEHVVRASDDDWARYESDRWHGLIQWLEENTDHPDRAQVVERLHKMQDEYFLYGREYLGWAMYALTPRDY
jgi:SAM-dependent methyltransferase